MFRIGHHNANMEGSAATIAAQFLVSSITPKGGAASSSASLSPFLPPSLSPFLPPSTSTQIKAAKRLQSVWRGHRLRQQLKRLLFQSKLSGSSIIHACEELERWHHGWINQFQLILLMLFYLVTVYYQVFSSRPSAFDTDTALMARMDQLDKARSSVSNSHHGYQFMRALIDEFGDRVDVSASAKCLDLLSILCPLDLDKYQEYYGNVTGGDAKFSADVLAACPDISRFSGYVDSSNRLVGTVYAYQTRRNAKPCSTKMRAIDAYQGTNSVRNCLTDELDTSYLPRPPSRCTTCNAFQYQHGAFFFAVTGDAFNLPTEFMKCRVDGLEIDKWLDFRTADLCFLVTLLDASYNGRIVAYKECFHFLDGGRVGNTREVASVSFLAVADGEPQPEDALFALTVTSIVLILARQAWVVYHIAVVRRKVNRWWYRELWSAGHVLRLVGPALELAANVLFLQHLASLVDFSFAQKMTKSMFYNDTFAYLREFDFTFDLADKWTQYTLIASLGLLFRLGDVVLSGEFHPSSALVSAILRQAGARLVSFFFVFASFILVYSFIGMLLFGRTTKLFADFGRALNTLMMLFVGEGQDLQQAILQPSSPRSLAVVQLCYFWIFVFIATVLLMSVLLAIIVGAFVEISGDAGGDVPMLDFSMTMWQAVRFVAGALVVKLRRALCAGRRRPSVVKDKDDDDDCEAATKKQTQLLLTPLEQLQAIQRDYRGEGCNAAELRPRLRSIYGVQTVERILNRCRHDTHVEHLAVHEMHLRGLEPGSGSLVGLSLGMLHTILAKLNNQQQQQQQPAAGATKNST